MGMGVFKKEKGGEKEKKRGRGIEGQKYQKK